MQQGLVFHTIPDTTQATKQTDEPFRLVLSATDFDSHIINLYCQGSLSTPYQVPQNKWSHLLPQWGFFDLSGNHITKVTTTDTIIYSGTNPVGVTGYADFYFVDDLPKGPCPEILWATLQTSAISFSGDQETQSVPSYANSKIVAACLWYVDGLLPTHLEITRNGSEDIQTVKWATVPMQYVVTINAADGSIVFNAPASGYDCIVNKILSGVPASAVTWDPNTVATDAPNYFQAYDNYGYNTGGFVKGQLTSSLSCLNAVISANATITYQNTFRNLANVWISNPANRTINRIWNPWIGDCDIPDFTNVAIITSDMGIYATPYLTSCPITGNPMCLTGFGGILGIAVDTNTDVWVTDFEMDKLYKYSSNGALLSTISLEYSGVASPAGISLDSNSNMWVSLFDSSTLLKYSSAGSLLQTVDLDEGEVAFENIVNMPTQVETDTNDNVWVTYSSYLCSAVFKYDSSGTRIATCTISGDAIPIDVVVDWNDNSIWVTESFGGTLSGRVSHYAATGGGAIESFSHGICAPQYITLDQSANPWFTFGPYYVGYLSGGQLQTFCLSAPGLIPDPSLNITTIDFQQLQGISTDAYGHILVINSPQNTLYILSNSGTTLQTIRIWPDEKIAWFNDNYGEMYEFASNWHESARAFGDWTGFRWGQKYTAAASTTTTTTTLTGISNVFNINPFSVPYNVRKFNGSWDGATQLRDYALSDHIHANYNLFVNYFGSILGGNELENQAFDRTSYERIANYVQNHYDIDTCNIPQLYSMAQLLDVPMDNYNFSYPSEVKRLVDIFSVSQGKLRGGRCQFRENFSGEAKKCCIDCTRNCPNNRGDIIDTNSYTITAGYPFVSKDKFKTYAYDLIVPPLSTNPTGTLALSTYPLSSVTNLGEINQSTLPYYNFYEYIATACDLQVEGVINWGDTYTTLAESMSSLLDWYGDDQVIEQVFNYWLHRGLQLNS